MCFTQCWQGQATRTDPGSLCLTYKRHMLMSFSQLTLDRCLLTRSNRTWKTQSLPLPDSGLHSPVESLFKQQALFLLLPWYPPTFFFCVGHQFCYCLKIPLFHDETHSWNFSNHIYNFKLWFWLNIFFLLSFFFSPQYFLECLLWVGLVFVWGSQVNKHNFCLCKV